MADEFWVACGSCGHPWVAAHLPMEMAKCARLLKGLACPSCGEGSGNVFLASEDAVIAERTRLASRATPTETVGALSDEPSNVSGAVK